MCEGERPRQHSPNGAKSQSDVVSVFSGRLSKPSLTSGKHILASRVLRIHSKGRNKPLFQFSATGEILYFLPSPLSRCLFIQTWLFFWGGGEGNPSCGPFLLMFSHSFFRDSHTKLNWHKMNKLMQETKRG